MSIFAKYFILPLGVSLALSASWMIASLQPPLLEPIKVACLGDMLGFM